MILSEKIKSFALEAGFDLCGIAPAGMLAEQKEYFDRWVAEGNGDTLAYLTRHGDMRFDPRLLVDGAKSVIVCAVNYKQPALDVLPGVPRIASYALATDYHTTMKRMLAEVFRRLREICPQVSGRAFVDSAPILEKAWAVRAGLGAIGRNSLLVTGQYGSRVLLGELVVDVAMDYDAPFVGDPCGKCSACIDSCPAEAILPGRCLDLRRCISRHTIERKSGGQIDKKQLHGWIFGCELCQECCPHNAATPAGRVISPKIEAARLTRDFWHNITTERFEELFGDTPLSRVPLGEIKSRL